MKPRLIESALEQRLIERVFGFRPPLHGCREHATHGVTEPGPQLDREMVAHAGHIAHRAAMIDENYGGRRAARRPRRAHPVLEDCRHPLVVWFGDIDERKGDPHPPRGGAALVAVQLHGMNSSGRPLSANIDSMQSVSMLSITRHG